MLCVVGTPNTKTGKLRSVIGEADEVLTYQDFAKRLVLNFGEVHDEHEEASKHEQQEPKQEDISERSPSEVAATMSRAMEILEPESSFAKIASELDGCFFGNTKNVASENYRQSTVYNVYRRTALP